MEYQKGGKLEYSTKTQKKIWHEKGFFRGMFANKKKILQSKIQQKKGLNFEALHKYLNKQKAKKERQFARAALKHRSNTDKLKEVQNAISEKYNKKLKTEYDKSIILAKKRLGNLGLYERPTTEGEPIDYKIELSKLESSIKKQHQINNKPLINELNRKKTQFYKTLSNITKARKDFADSTIKVATAEKQLADVLRNKQSTPENIENARQKLETARIDKAYKKELKESINTSDIRESLLSQRQKLIGLTKKFRRTTLEGLERKLENTIAEIKTNKSKFKTVISGKTNNKIRRLQRIKEKYGISSNYLIQKLKTKIKAKKKNSK